MLGVYGDVLCVKILFKKRDCALVHMAKPHHAAQAKQHLDQFKVGGKNLIVSFSKLRSLLKDKLVDEEGLQKIYTKSSLHRFKNIMAEKKQLKNLRPPSNLLHVGNIPDGMEHTDIKVIVPNLSRNQYSNNQANRKDYPMKKKMARAEKSSSKIINLLEGSLLNG